VADLLRIAVASDLHAFSDPGATIPSHLDIKRPKSQLGKHPISGLVSLISEHNLKADVLLCPGDLGDKASTEGIEFAWRAIHDIGTALQAKLVVGTAGNHDLDSRHLKTYDSVEFLKRLDPRFPISIDALNRDFWARHFAVVDESDYRILILNSSAYHGGAPDEIKHGRVADDSLDAIEETLESLDVKPINILLCHHHPQEHVEIESVDYQVMKGGQRLLHLLGSGTFGRWLVVHGHMHHPKIEYAQGAGDSPAILSAGSLCAVIYSTLQTLARNEFHIVSFSLDDIAKYGFVGRVESWDWAFGDGWAPSRPGSGLPHVCGFGFRTDLEAFAREVAVLVPADYMAWEDLRRLKPRIDFLIPQDVVKLLRFLKRDHQIGVLQLEGVPKQIGRYK
jgi:predicted phosphodiesterase